ncbi:hypothetical protein [Chryseobacterium viscerum]|uniref:Uncharacterized protein n=1 Tax=Chryseobacterium viscerum TaxID=1037377 RepID=A0A316WCK9_9FLAO|nr:hypothetical protein [Chryseobacterium viscerum]PWN59047.1 hypothetical protein C1634_020815 [Chryseobacterium viscerum]
MPVIILFSNVMYSVISHVKKELYEKTQCSIVQSNFKKSETIFFTEKDLKEAEWKEEKEFTLNGFSYDIIKVSIINGKKYFFCYMDRKDIIINSLLDFSKKLAGKKTCLKLQIDLPGHNKSMFKIPGFFAIFEKKGLCFFSNHFLETIFKYYNQQENTHYLAIIIPPPERDLL